MVTLLLEAIRPGADVRIRVSEDGQRVSIGEGDPDHCKHTLSISSMRYGHELVGRARARRCSGLPSVGSVVLELEPPPPGLMLYTEMSERGQEEFAKACAVLAEAQARGEP